MRALVDRLSDIAGVLATADEGAKATLYKEPGVTLRFVGSNCVSEGDLRTDATPPLTRMVSLSG